MICDWNNKLSAFHDGELPAEARAQVEAHVAACPECAAEIGRLRRIARFLRAAPIPAMSAGALPRLHNRLGAERIMLANGRRTARLAGWLTTAAAAVILCCGAALYSMQSQPGLSHQTAQHTARDGDDSIKVLMNAVIPGSELAASLETTDPLALAIDRYDPRDDGRE